MNELVSVIMPTFKNNGSNLEKAINSIVLQTYYNWELIIIDDNIDEFYSKKVIEIIESFKNNQIRYFKNNTNLGSAQSRNKGIDLSTGKYITFLDDDDIYISDKIEKQLTLMIAEKADYCISNLELRSEKGKLLERRSREYLNDKETDTETLFLYHLKYHMTGTDTLMYKKDYLLKIGKFPSIDLGDEFYLMFNSIINNGKFCYCNHFGVIATVHEGEIGLSSGQNKIKCEEQLYKFKMNYFNKLDLQTIKYIKTRHFCVLAFAEMRRKNFILMLKYSILSIINSPKYCISIMMNRR